MADEKKRLSFRKSRRIRVLIIILSVIAMVSMFPDGQALEFDVSVGSIWIRDDLIATRTFEILKDKQVYEQEVRNATASVYPIYVLDDTQHETVLDSLESYNEYLLETIDSEVFYNNADNENNVFLSKEAFTELKKLRLQESNISSKKSASLNNIFRATKYLIDRIYNRGLIDRNYSEIGADSFIT